MPTSEVAVQSNIWENNSILKEKRQNSNKQNYMPFLFRSKRQFPQINQQTPPVGAYHIQSAFNIKSQDSQPSILKEQFQRKNQMCIFKSNQQRFIPNRNNMPGPASYNFSQNESNKKFAKLFPQKRGFQNPNEKLSLMKRSPSCPAIPDSKVRYGYTKDKKGNYKLIQKTENQVQREKLKLKEYCATLVGQNQFMKRNQLNQDLQISKILKRQQQILNNLQKFVERNQSSLSQSRFSQSVKSIKLNKPKIKLSYGVNVIKSNEDHLGPGCYDYSLDTMKKGKKDQNFQFFSSSQIRFVPIIKESVANPYDQMFKENRNKNFKPNSQGKVYKRSFPVSPIDPYYLQKNQLPGPGYYEPEVQNIKKSYGNVKFGDELRFKQNSSQLNQYNFEENVKEVQASQNNMKWGNLRKDKLKSPHKEFEPVKQSQIYGIMNEQPSETIINAKKTKFNLNKGKQSAVFRDKSSRLNICNKTYFQGENLQVSKQKIRKLWDAKGIFISRISNKHLELQQDTPGPGAYDKLVMGKKTFNIKNL